MTARSPADLLAEILPETLESMLFAEAEQIDDVFDWADDTAFYSHIEIHRPVVADVTIGVPLALAEEFAMALAPEAADDEGAVLDLIGELSNTLAGRLGAALCSTDEAVELGLPKTERGLKPRPASNDSHQTYTVGDSLLGVSIVAKAS